MNRNEAKAYALNELGLDRDTVRQFGNLSRTQTWLDAIAAQASGGIAAQASEGIAAQEEAIAAHKDEIAPCQTMIVEETPGIAPEPAAPDNSFETFWDSPPALLPPQPLINVSVLDEDWDEPELPASPASDVIVYPIVIGLVMLWAMVQLLLLGGKALCWLLSGVATGLDAMAQERLQRQRESNLALSPGLIFASPSLDSLP